MHEVLSILGSWDPFISRFIYIYESINVASSHQSITFDLLLKKSTIFLSFWIGKFWIIHLVPKKTDFRRVNSCPLSSRGDKDIVLAPIHAAGDLVTKGGTANPNESSNPTAAFSDPKVLLTLVSRHL